MAKIGQFGDTAISAVDICKRDAISAEDSWEIACRERIANENSRGKSCPKLAFLGIVHSGLVKGIDAFGDVSRKYKTKNGQYALNAIEILQDDHSLAQRKRILWKRVMEKSREDSNKTQNNQMEVVIALWEKHFINRL